MKKVYYKILVTQKKNAGFTLIELLVAMAITTIVVSIAGFGLVTITSANTKAETETQRRVDLNRALDFISNEVRIATQVNDRISAPTWAWTSLGSTGSPSAQLYLQIPYKAVNSMTSGGSITVNNHGLSNGNAVIFTGYGTIATGLSKNQRYYLRDVDTNTFNLSDTVGGTAKTLTSNSSGSLTVNQLIIYYIRDNTSTWLKPKTINRSVGDCESSYAASNCNTLVDSIAASGFITSVTSSRQADLRLIGSLDDQSTQTYEVSTKAFTRANP